MKFYSTADAGFEAAFVALLNEARETAESVDQAVGAIIADVRARGDAAVLDYTKRFDRLELTARTLRVSTAEIDAAVAEIPAELMAALDLAAERIEVFHRAQMPTDLRMTDSAGLTLGMRWGALDAVGLYVPGGKAAYPSSVLMNALPARVAGVGRIARVARLAYLFNGIMKADNIDAAWDWISFWGETDPSIAFLEETGYFPASSVIAKDARITGNPLYQAAAETLGFGTLPPAFVGMAGWSQNSVLPEFQKILVGQSTPEKATDAMLKGLDAALN